MQTSASRKLTAGCLVLLSSLAANVCNAQLTLWLKADAGDINAGSPSNLDEVTAWADSSSSSFDLTGASGTAPIWHNDQINGSSESGFLRFDGINDVLSRNGILGGDLFGATEAAVFMVIRPGVGNNANSLLSWSDGNNYFQVAENDPAPADKRIFFYTGNFNPGGDLDHSAPQPDPNWENNWLILSVVRNGNAGDIRVGGASIGSDANAYSSVLDTGVSAPLTVGATANPLSQYWGGDIAEIRVYDSGSVNVGAIEAELGAAYNLAPVPEPSQYATVFALACVAGAMFFRVRRQRAAA